MLNQNATVSVRHYSSLLLCVISEPVGSVTIVAEITPSFTESLKLREWSGSSGLNTDINYSLGGLQVVKIPLLLLLSVRAATLPAPLRWNLGSDSAGCPAPRCPSAPARLWGPPAGEARGSRPGRETWATGSQTARWSNQWPWSLREQTEELRGRLNLFLMSQRRKSQSDDRTRSNWNRGENPKWESNVFPDALKLHSNFSERFMTENNFNVNLWEERADDKEIKLFMQLGFYFCFQNVPIL